MKKKPLLYIVPVFFLVLFATTVLFLFTVGLFAKSTKSSVSSSSDGTVLAIGALGNHPPPIQVQMEREELLPNNASSDPRKTSATTTSTTNCPSTLDFVTRGDIKCDTVASMEWFLTTKEGLVSLQGLTKGLSLEQIGQRQKVVTSTNNSDHHVLTASSVDEDDYHPLNSNSNNKKRTPSDNSGVPIVAPISPSGEMVSSKCSPYLKDPLLINCETIGSMLWFLTTDEGIASLQGMVDGMEADRIVQRHAIISIFKDFNMTMTTKDTKNRKLGISFVFNECDLEGITCNSRGKITKIELNGKGLSGKVSLDFLKLQNSLKVLDLSSNYLSGEIPVQIASLEQLTYLDLSHNAFTGSVPSNLRKLRNLRTMNLAGNKLSGKIPSWLRKLKKLKFLYMHENTFTGSFPTGVCLPLRAKGGTVSSDCFGEPPMIACEWQTCCNLCYPTSWQQRGSAIDGEYYYDNFGISVALSGDGTVLAIGAPFNDGNGDWSGHVRVYEWNAGNFSWEKRGDDIDGDATSDGSGRSVSLSSDGTVLAIGADRNGSYYTGHVRVYVWNADTSPPSWQKRGDDIDGEAQYNYAGSSVSLSSDGTVLAIGARGGFGRVRVYEWKADISSWHKMGTDIDGEAASDGSGRSASLSGDGTVVAIGAVGNDGNGTDSGHVRVYGWRADTSPPSWVQRGIAIVGEAADDGSGDSVVLSSDGTILAIGARWNDGNGANSGHVRVYEWNADTLPPSWNQLGTDIDGEAADDLSGTSVSLSSDGTVLAIGAPGNVLDSTGYYDGHVRVYEWNADTSSWRQRRIDIDAEATGDKFGTSVSLSNDGTVLAIGAPFNDGNGTDSGHVRVYQFMN